MQQDGKHLSVGASLRKGALYVKAPYHKTVELVRALDAAGEDLLLKKVYWKNDSKYQPFVFVGPAEDWVEDLTTLISLVNDEKDPTGIIREFHSTLTLGLSNNPEVDWVDRIGGPALEAPAPPAGPAQSEHTEPDRDIPLDLAGFVTPPGAGVPRDE